MQDTMVERFAVLLFGRLLTMPVCLFNSSRIVNLVVAVLMILGGILQFFPVTL